MLHVYVFYITMTPYLPCNNNINRKELYDFYYTLTTGYKALYYLLVAVCMCMYM